MAQEEGGKSAVVLDIDGVVNNFSNKRFYVSFAYHALHELAKVHSRRSLLQDLPKLKKLGGPNALFRFIFLHCGDEKTFNQYCHKLALKLNYDLIPHDPSMVEFMKRLGKYGKVCIRSDGLSEIAGAVWDRVIENKSSGEIKTKMMQNWINGVKPEKDKVLDGKPIYISGIVENRMKIKSSENSGWDEFAKRYDMDLQRSVLIDDSSSNRKVARKLGMTVVPISKLDSLLQGTFLQGMQKRSLSDILGKRMSDTLKHLNLSYGKKVDLRDVFRVLLKLPAKRNKEVTNGKKPTNNGRTD